MPCVKTEALFTQAPKFTAVLQTHGITVRSVLHLKTISKTHGSKKFVQQNKYNVGLDSAILMNPQTWVASGHLGGFSDPLMDCKECKTRHRADNLIEDFDGTNVAGWTNEEMMNYIKEKRDSVS